ncbi:MAG: hypothetical protein WA003_01230 [Desulfuromonadaceae bacterium]
MYEDLSENIYERLKILYYYGNDKYNRALWMTECICGKKSIKNAYSMKNGNTRSCGCLQNECTKLKGFNNKKHGDTNTKFYLMWKFLRQRCNNLNNASYKNYGGRGIKYDLSWDKYENFKKDMWYFFTKAILCEKIKKPSIERINVNGDYNRKNCTFIELRDQPKNQRRIRVFKAISPDGKIYFSKNVKAFSLKNKLSPTEVYNCLNNKMKQHKGWKFVDIDFWKRKEIK